MTTILRYLFPALIAGHGLLHLMGFAKAFGYAELPQLTQPIPKAVGFAWLAAALGLVATAGLFLRAPRIWWAVGLGAVALSQVVIGLSWTDAKAGTIVNLMLLVGVIYGFASEGPWSLRAEFRREVNPRLAQPVSQARITETELAHLPEPVGRYVRQSGALGQPRIHHLRARWRGRIRAAAHDPWMVFSAEQVNFIDEPSRFFLMQARRSGLPVDVLHTYTGEAATMRVRLLSLLPMVRTGGSEMRRAETVTLLNDLSILAPAALVHPAIRWEAVDAHSARAHYTVAGTTISAVLVFNDAGEMVDFVSDDRLMASPDGATFRPMRWSTPLRDYRRLGKLRVATRGEGRWHPPEGDFVYIELTLLELGTNDGRQAGQRGPTAGIDAARARGR